MCVCVCDLLGCINVYVYRREREREPQLSEIARERAYMKVKRGCLSTFEICVFKSKCWGILVQNMN